MIQAEIARDLNISPQAVDRRITGLFLAVVRELEKKYGFTEPYIRKLYRYKSGLGILRMMI